MKVIFSRKGFDSASGGAPSPIVDGVPISLPIPTRKRSVTTYADLRLGDVVETVTKGRVAGRSLCHFDPMFEAGRCAFGQTGAAQAHLRNNGVGIGDVFLFFGLFADADGGNRHHRVYGYLEVESVHAIGASPTGRNQPAGFRRRHPHTIGEWNPNNTIYLGPGRVASKATTDLRLSRSGGQVSRWHVPRWLRAAGLTYHGNRERWIGRETLILVGRGQEFVCDISAVPEALPWLERMKAAICGEE